MFKTSYTSFLNNKHYQETLIFNAADPIITGLLNLCLSGLSWRPGFYASDFIYCRFLGD